MDIQTLTTFLMWCTILNLVLMTLSFLITVFAGDVAYRIHCMWFPMPRETFNAMLYAFISFYKFMFFFFNVIPLVALLLVT
jgi:hypothetical protein